LTTIQKNCIFKRTTCGCPRTTDFGQKKRIFMQPHVYKNLTQQLKITLLISLCLRIANFTIYNNTTIGRQKIDFTLENKISSIILQTILECMFNVHHEANNRNKKTQLRYRILFEPTYCLQNQPFLSSAERCTTSDIKFNPM
jgi:hypothetical protein